jgi:uncharacterized protein (TIGR02646 family)
MIPVVRTNEPDVLRRNRRRWTDQYLTAIADYENTASERNLARRRSAERRYNHQDVRNELVGMCHHKCVYCESHVTHIGYPHIEHYRPKSIYPRSCFTWTNLLLGCSICNGVSFKGDKFPLAGDDGPLVNPERDDPAAYFDFEYDQVAGVSAVIPKNDRARTTERILGLNRPDLLRHRNLVVKKLAVIAFMASQGHAEALDELRHSMQPEQEYSAFAIAFHRKFKLA